MKSIKILTSTFALLLLFNCFNCQAQNTIPFSTDSTHLTIWNGTEYVPFFMKGINLGVAVPGTFPGQLAATAEDYALWFQQIKDAGFNCIRLYTLHFPRFFDELKKFNDQNKNNPLLFLQGVWLEEEYPGYHDDLYFISDVFKNETEENIDCVHGKRVIASRVGKAHGTYTTDVSKWCLGYVVGREIYPAECLGTDEKHPTKTSFIGDHFSITNGTPSETWITEMLDHAVKYEKVQYNTQRPVTSSSWPTLDPMHHPEEEARDEDTVAIDYAKIKIVDAPAGYFISYHAYPYYPDFVSLQSNYQSESDSYGPNSYKSYLAELKTHYAEYPLIIAEYGVPSSWAIAHYATSGMNHGGFDEYNQGLTNVRMLNTIENTNCGGGIQFSWLDEWFKRTWVTDDVDYIADSRILWHNIAAAEQNFGLAGYEKTLYQDTVYDLNENSDIPYITAEVNYTFFELEIGLKEVLTIEKDLWVTLDTYSKNLGERILSTGDTIPNRSEFALHITNYSAELHVTQAYDIYGIYHKLQGTNQLHRSVATDGDPWNLVRIKNNNGESDIQYTGNLQLNYDFQPESSMDAVTIYDDKIKVRIPWSYINVVSPDQMKVYHDDRNTTEKEDTISDGFAVSVLHQNKWHTIQERIVWEPWVYIPGTAVNERLKRSYYVMQDNLQNYNSDAIAYRDSFSLTGPVFPQYITKENGLLKNDFDIDGNTNTLICLLDENPKNGTISLNADGSFNYTPNAGFNGVDSLKYFLFDGQTLSTSNSVIIDIAQNTNVVKQLENQQEMVVVYPNPAIDQITISSSVKLNFLQLIGPSGKLIETYQGEGSKMTIDLSTLKKGTYIFVISDKNGMKAKRFIKH